MTHYEKILKLTTAVVAVVSFTTAYGASPKTSNARTPWNGFYVGGLLGGKVVGGKGAITTNVDGKEVTSSKDDVVFPLPSHTLTLGFGGEIGCCSTLTFGCDLDYGVLPTFRLSYGYLITPLDRVSFGVGVNALLLGAAISEPKGLTVSSLGGFTPSISYERSLGMGAFFQAQVCYNYLSIKGDNLEPDFKFPAPIKRFIRDYWEKDVNAIKSVDASAHGITLALGFGLPSELFLLRRPSPHQGLLMDATSRCLGRTCALSHVVLLWIFSMG